MSTPRNVVCNKDRNGQSAGSVIDGLQAAKDELKRKVDAKRSHIAKTEQDIKNRKLELHRITSKVQLGQQLFGSRQIKLNFCANEDKQWEASRNTVKADLVSLANKKADMGVERQKTLLAKEETISKLSKENLGLQDRYGRSKCLVEIPKLKASIEKLGKKEINVDAKLVVCDKRIRDAEDGNAKNNASGCIAVETKNLLLQLEKADNRGLVFGLIHAKSNAQKSAETLSNSRIQSDDRSNVSPVAPAESVAAPLAGNTSAGKVGDNQRRQQPNKTSVGSRSGAPPPPQQQQVSGSENRNEAARRGLQLQNRNDGLVQAGNNGGEQMRGGESVGAVLGSLSFLNIGGRGGSKNQGAAGNGGLEDGPSGSGTLF